MYIRTQPKSNWLEAAELTTGELIPSTYYCTHSIAPVMYITDTHPVKVNGFVVPYDFNDPTQTMHMKRSDTCAVHHLSNG